MPPRKLNMSNLDEVDEFVQQTAEAVSLFADDDGDILKILPLDRIDPNPHQPRKSFDAEELQDLAASIASIGVVQPILVTRAGERFQLIAGERRVRASQLAGKTTIKAVVTRSASPSVAALVENIQRADLNALELADGVRTMLRNHATQRDVARLIGKSDTYVSRSLKLLELPESIRAEYPAHARRVGINAMFEIAEAEPKLRAALWEQAKEGAPIKALRAARKETAARETAVAGAPSPPLASPASGPSAVLFKSIAKLTKELSGLLSGLEAGSLHDEQAEALRALRDRIDALLPLRR